MPIVLRLLAVLAAVVALPGCGGFNLDPGPGREVPKADSRLTDPPADLRNGTAR